MTSVKLRTSWIDNNAIIEGVRIYKSNQAFTSANLPQLLIEITDGSLFYEDFDVEENETYYYMLSCYLDQQEVFTECFEVDVELFAADPQFNSVKLLMQFDGNTPLTDQKTGAIWTLHGDAFVDTTDRKFTKGGALRLSDAVTSYARSPVLTNMQRLSSHPKTVTVEFFFKKTSSIGNAGAVCFQNADNLSERYAFFMRAGALNYNLAVYSSAWSTFIDIPSGKNLNEWVHFAYVEPGSGQNAFYIDGVKQVLGSTPGNLIDFWPKTIVTIGQSGNNGESFGGLIDGLRVSSVARYTTSFIPPDAPFGVR